MYPFVSRVEIKISNEKMTLFTVLNEIASDDRVSFSLEKCLLRVENELPYWNTHVCFGLLQADLISSI